jgi:hypothetical protein
MMQVTRAAFQAFASLNKQATDPKSHTLVGNFYTRFSPVSLPAIPMVDPNGFQELGTAAQRHDLNGASAAERLERFEQIFVDA